MIAKRFDELRSKGEKALVLFVTAGDPGIEDLPAILEALQEGGADLIEIGLPFSDPIADGPVIQASSFRALQRGVSVQKILDATTQANVTIPLIYMTYMNPVRQFGISRFCQSAKNSGVSGMIVSDLIPDEAEDWKAIAHGAGLDTIFLAAPTSTDERLDLIAGSASGFVYVVSRTGVTGDRPATADEIEAINLKTSDVIVRLRKRTDKPLLVGFGIKEPDDVARYCAYAEGVIVGSALVKRLAASWDGGAGREEIVGWVSSLKGATRVS